LSLNPIHTTEAIKEAYIRYLTTTFSIKEPELRDQFREILQEPGKFVKGPILEVTPSFLNGASIQDLVSEGILSPQFLTLNSKGLPVDQPLYRHQEDAIRKLVEHRRNIVVATGTGSGKTETFMIPIIDHLLKEKTAGKLGPGVRALLLYPMNALANDQMKRLRLLLKNMPDLTFGRYTGETEEKTTAAIDKYYKFYGFMPLDNELVSRQQMWESPPHILLTNYAMLEYLLLRPQDSVFFDGPNSGSWKFIVIDEAHVYSGAKGIEIAMLLRRLKDRITGGKNRGIQCIATSATLGNGRDDAPQVVEFASRLFGAEFNWMENDASRQDVVYAAREPLNGEEKVWGQFTPEVYLQLREIIADDTSETIPRLDQLVSQQAPSRVVDLARAQGERYGWQAYLYTILAGDQRVHQLQSLLEEEAQYLAQLADQVFPDTDRAQDCLIALVDLGSQARLEKESRSLLPARYHIFVKSLDGAYVALSPAKRLFLEPQRTTEIDGKTYRAFEIATCRNCGALYLTGKRTEIDDRDYLVAADGASAEYYLVETALEDIGDIDEDEDVGIEDLEKLDRYNLCLCCGAIDRLGSLGELCDCSGEHHQVVTKVPANKNGTVSTCTACGRTSPLGIIWRLLVGSDAAAAVLATALYQEIEPLADALTVSSQNDENDYWGAGPEEVSSKHNEKGSRKLLAFSDSRQDAAFFAPYLNRTYNQIQRRSLILRTIHSYRQKVLSNQWRVNDLIEPLLRVTEDLEWFGRDMSRQMRKDEVTRWLMHELMALDRRNSLEGLGLLGFSLVKPSNWFSPRGLEGTLGLSSDEVWTLVSVLLDTLRRQGAILFPDNVSPKDEFFSPRNREYYFRSHSDSAGRAKGIMGWNSNRLNSRLDYLQRLASNTQAGLSNEDCRTLLNEIWNRFIVKQYKDGFFKDYFVEDNLRGEGVVFRLRPEMWELKPTLIDDTLVWYICDKCNSLTLHNLRDTCTTFRCNGRLRPCHPQEINANNHYYLLYQNILPQRMIAQEHTAQLTSGAAADLQNKFLQGKVNILSCSTTFELGVDVGSLETVFMRNVPPTTANYVQRAGRAGRRKNSAALALTFAQRRSHDFDHFREPWRMVSGKIGVPHFKLENHKIIRRHMNAMALASFWYKNQPYFGKGQGRLKDFFLNNPPGPEAFADYLRTQPADLLDALRRVVPPHLHDDLGIDDWAWVETLFQGDEAYLAKAAEEVLGDLTQLEELRHQYFEQRKNLDHLNRLINTIENKNLIGYLASRSVLPKYGFPVDVVELQLPHHGEEARRLQLERDLRIAISEYAPGGQVVAGGKVWTSRYIKRRPNKAWDRYKYAICPTCSNFVIRREEFEEDFGICSVCQSNFGRGKGTFVVPSFGFIADNRPPGNPGENRPDRTFSTRVFFSGEVRKEEVPTVLDCGCISISAVPASFAWLTVINKAGNSGFKVCSSCGYTILGDESAPNTHPRPWGGDCRGSLEKRLSLGHQFHTDILKLTFYGHRDNDDGFWVSLLYALLEGASAALDIERQDLDGCIYYAGGDSYTPQLILYDEVPGGAGHVHRMADPSNLTKVLQVAWKRLATCDCGGKEGHASCYSCLRNYRNQYCHEKLDRRVAMDFLAQFQDLLA
jgi:ATP-dependent helicase YprA (DUF1998 family)